MKQAYNALGKRTNAVMRGAVTKGVRDFLVDKIPPARVQKLVNAIDFKTAAEFKRAVDKATDWLKKEAHGKPYILYVEGGDLYAKSSDWLAHKVIEKLGMPWGRIVWGNISEMERRFRAAYAHGVTTVVHLDDAWYTGTQKKEQIETLLMTWRRVLNTHRNAPSAVHAKILVAAAYGPHHLPKHLQEVHGTHATHAPWNTSARKDTFDVKLFAAAEIPEPPRNLAVLGNVNFGRRKYTVMPHKLADGLSFGFHLWNPSTHKLEAFRDAIKAPQPIYKNERYLQAERRKRNLRVRAPAMKKTGRTK